MAVTSCEMLQRYEAGFGDAKAHVREEMYFGRVWCVKGSRGETKSWKQGGRNEGGGGREGERRGVGEARSTSWGDQRQFFLAPALQLLPDGARLPTFVFAARTSHILVSRGIVTVPTTPAAHVKCKNQRKKTDRPKKQVHGVGRQCLEQVAGRGDTQETSPRTLRSRSLKLVLVAGSWSTGPP